VYGFYNENVNYGSNTWEKAHGVDLAGIKFTTVEEYVMHLGRVAKAEEKAEAKAEEKKAEPKMRYRMLGNTGLQVSVFAFGFWASYGVKGDLTQQAGVDRAKDVLRIARKAGINLFDNAETYGNPEGAAEEIMGEAIAQLRKEDPKLWRRSEIVVSTKIFWGGHGRNEMGLSNKHLKEGMEACLARLQMSYVDLIFAHRPDPLTPTATVVRAFTNLIRSGKATAWGTSEWSAQQITEAFWIARMEGLEPPQFEQPEYHMFERQRVEEYYHPLYQEPYRIGTTIWSPLASGLLTGKYNDSVPSDSRLNTPGYEWLKDRLETWQKDGKIEKVRKLTAIAKQLGCSVSQLAIAWVLRNPNVSTCILGATKTEQLTENLGALSVTLTDDHMKQIEDILGNKPKPYQGYGGARGYRDV
jgi:voltage-dependent potassium channel beta subunit